MIANAITIFRLVLLAVFVWLVMEGFLMAGLVVFAIAWALDAVDGAVARRFHGESELGSFLDKMADRLLLGTAALILVGRGFIPVWGLFIISKEALLLVVLWWQAKEPRPIAGAGMLGKVNTLLQGVAIVWLALGWPGAVPLVVVVAGMGVFTAARYWKSY